MGVIYCATNKVNGKIYIGAVCLGKRKTAEGYHWEHVKDKV
jgi:hypothetical protein